jgi:hypothetical protein
MGCHVAVKQDPGFLFRFDQRLPAHLEVDQKDDQHSGGQEADPGGGKQSSADPVTRAHRFAPQRSMLYPVRDVRRLGKFEFVMQTEQTACHRSVATRSNADGPRSAAPGTVFWLWNC